MIDPRLDPDVQAYDAYCAAVRGGTAYRVPETRTGNGLLPGEATHQQVLDVLCAIADYPISTWMIFKAGWDAARAGASGGEGS